MRVQPPIITSTDCEGAGEVFSISSKRSPNEGDEEKRTPQGTDVPFFKDIKCLTVSSQLHLEAFVHEHPKVWTMSPSFRAEKSDTARHLSEFWMVEAEMQTENIGEVMDLVEEMIQSLTIALQDTGFKDELIHAHHERDEKAKHGTMQSSEHIEQRWRGLVESSWPRISYGQAIQRLQSAVNSNEATFRYEPSWSNGLQLEHERYIADVVGRGSPVFVTDYPQYIKPFYMLPSSLEITNVSPEERTMSCFDLLLPDMCEVVGGSLREHRLANLVQSMHKKGLEVVYSDNPSTIADNTTTPSQDQRNLDWYVDLRRYGSVPHGGFGLGFDRLLGYLSSIPNVKDIVPWPRHYGRCDC